MSIRVIEAFDTPEHTGQTCTIEGRTYPVCCLVEDDLGLRYFLTPTPEAIPARLWVAAHSGGAVGLVTPLPDGWGVMTAERFMDVRGDSLNTQSFVVKGGWRRLVQKRFPTYIEMVAEDAPASSTSAGFVHLHTHSEFSPLDGLSTVEEIVREAVADNQPALAITDHGICAGHPELQKVAAKAGIKPIFGIEAYFCDDRLSREPEQKDDYFHLILWAMNDEGLRNLWAMSTESYRDGFYYRARMDWDTLTKYSTGVMASSACLRGPLSVPILAGDDSLAVARLGRLQNIFKDRFYLELHSNHLEEQKKVNEALVSLSRDHGVPLVAVVDSHYPTANDHDAHKAWLACQTNSDVQDESDLFAVNLDLYVQREAEVRAALAYLGDAAVDEAVASTLTIADRCNAQITRRSSTPTFSKVGGAPRDAERLWDLCMESWEHKTTGKRESQQVYMARFEREFKMLVDKGFCGYFLMVADYVLWAKRNGILVGPGRGSGGGSLVAYLCGIIEIDPVDADLLFERFMTEGRTALPDFDVDFPASKRDEVQHYLTQKYGDSHVIRVGTHIRHKNKGVIKDLGRALKSTLPESAFVDLVAVSKIIDEAEASTAGLGLPWEELWAQEGDRLDPYREKYPDLFAMADRLVGRLKSYGKHAAGIVISTDDPLTDRLPLRGGENEQMVAQHDMTALEDQGLIKFDVLTLRTLDTIQMCVDLIREKRGITVNVYNWKEEYHDPHVWEEIAAAHTLGIFQIETTSGTRLTKQMQPRSVAELADMITLVRPGPMRSGLTATYLKRRDGLESVSVPDPRLSPVLSKTFGCLLYQEDIMAATMVLAHYDGNEADAVRKILGKKQVEKVQEAGQKFVAAAVEYGMDSGAAAGLWMQMAEFAKYSFNRAHAFSYAVLGYWCAWFKFHYPAEFLTAALSSVDKDRIPDFIQEARRMGYSVLPPDINISGRGFTADALTVRYGLDSIKGVGPSGVEAIVQGQPYTSFEDFLERKGPGANAGIISTLAHIGAFDSLVPNRRGLETLLAAQKAGEDAKCVFKDLTVRGAPNNLPCHFDWANEPPVMGRTGKPMKLKPPPKKCTKACRQYVAPPPMNMESVTPYTAADIRDIEMDLLGVYLSSTPFDVMDPQEREICATQAEQVVYGPSGAYVLAGLLVRIKPWRDSGGNEMGFLDFETERGPVNVTALSKTWAKYHRHFQVNRLAFIEVEKNDRGLSLAAFVPAPA